MGFLEDNASRFRFEAYVNELIGGVIGHADRAVPLHDYCTGLLLPGERKSVEPMAALTAPDLIAERAIFPPSAPRREARPATPAVSAGHRSEAATRAPRTAYTELDRHAPTPAYCCLGSASTAVSMLRRRSKNRPSSALPRPVQSMAWRSGINLGSLRVPGQPTIPTLPNLVRCRGQPA